jgi:hypothetical protein
MADVVPGRTTAAHEGSVVVFLIGMRVNSFWRLRQWLPTAMAMGPMLRELSKDPSSGFLGYEMSLALRGPVLVQYWRSTDDLFAYARSAAGAHRPAWQAFNERARSGSGAVGIWHETYAVPAGGHECVYASMPATGLAKVSGQVPVARRGETATERLAG